MLLKEFRSTTSYAAVEPWCILTLQKSRQCWQRVNHLIVLTPRRRTPASSSNSPIGMNKEYQRTMTCIKLKARDIDASPALILLLLCGLNGVRPSPAHKHLQSTRRNHISHHLNTLDTLFLFSVTETYRIGRPLTRSFCTAGLLSDPHYSLEKKANQHAFLRHLCTSYSSGISYYKWTSRADSLRCRRHISKRWVAFPWSTKIWHRHS